MAPRHRGLVKNRTTYLFAVFALLYAGVAGRLVYIQIACNDRYVDWAKKIRARQLAIPAARGNIFDRNGRALGVNIETASVFANLKEIPDPPRTAIKVAALLGDESQRIEEKLSGKRGFVWLRRHMPAEVADEVRKDRFELPGIGTQTETKRVYPAGQVAAQVIGFTDIDNKGVEGAECVFNRFLCGSNGLISAELDGGRRIIPITRRLVREPEPGKDVYLTIDINIQHIAEQALARMAQNSHPRSACAVVMDPHTGEILALANLPGFDLNKAHSTKSALWRNRAVADLYEPGSTLKVVTVAAGLNEGMSPHAIMAVCTGMEKIKGGRIPCTLHHPFKAGHGSVDMYKIIRYSCNIGAAHIALKLGADKLYSYEKSFGLLDRTNAGFGCEAVCPMVGPDKWETIRLADIGFGQGMAVTALQMASVYSTVANRGVRVSPTVLREVTNADGTIFRPFKPARAHRVISAAAAGELTKMLMGCVDEGTGKPARIDGRTIAGKTGSAQAPRVGGRGYEPGAFVASFMGFAPASRRGS